MSSRDKARKQVEDLINKRVALHKRFKEERTEKETAEYAVFECIKRLEELSQLNDMGSNEYLRPVVNLIFGDLKTKLRAIDNGVHFDVEWSETEENKLPRMESVKIVWSEKFAAERQINREQNVSVSEIIVRYCL